MNTKLLLFGVIVAILVAIIACTKDKNSVKPQLGFKSINNSRIEKGQPLTVILSFTDPDGDLQDSIYVQRTSYNCDYSIIEKFAIPRFLQINSLQAEVDVTYYYSQGGRPLIVNGCVTGNSNDSSYFRFWVNDDAGNVSDTVKTPDFVLLK